MKNITIALIILITFLAGCKESNDTQPYIPAYGENSTKIAGTPDFLWMSTFEYDPDKVPRDAWIIYDVFDTLTYEDFNRHPPLSVFAAIGNSDQMLSPPFKNYMFNILHKGQGYTVGNGVFGFAIFNTRPITFVKSGNWIQTKLNKRVKSSCMVSDDGIIYGHLMVDLCK